MNESGKMATNLMPLLSDLPPERKESFKVVLVQALNISYKDGKIDGKQEVLNQLQDSFTEIERLSEILQQQGNIDDFRKSIQANVE